MSKHLRRLCYQNLVAYDIGHQKFIFNITEANWILTPTKRFSKMMSSERNVHINNYLGWSCGGHGKTLPNVLLKGTMGMPWVTC